MNQPLGRRIRFGHQLIRPLVPGRLFDRAPFRASRDKNEKPGVNPGVRIARAPQDGIGSLTPFVPEPFNFGVQK